jgi:hypothetical protein
MVCAIIKQITQFNPRIYGGYSHKRECEQKLGFETTVLPFFLDQITGGVDVNKISGVGTIFGLLT